MNRSVWAMWPLLAVCLTLGAPAWFAADAGVDGRIAFVEQVGRGSGEGPRSFLHIPRAGVNYVDIWDRYTFDIYTMAPDGSDPVRITTDGTSRGPQWSWDGEWLAYVSGPVPLQSLYVVRWDGTDRKALLEREQGIERYWWSLDSKRLLVAAESRRSSSRRPSGREASVLEGSVIDVRTGKTASLSNSEWMRGWNHWEPTSDEVVNPRPRLLEALAGVVWPNWSPSGEFIAFLYDGLLALAHAPSVSDTGNWFLQNDEPLASGIIEWSRDGRWLLFHGGSSPASGSRQPANVGSRGSTGMLVAELDAKQYRWGDVHLVTTREGGGGTFNGDGTRIVFLSTPPGKMNSELFVVDVTGENEQQLTFSRVNHIDLSWQPFPQTREDSASPSPTAQ